MDSNNELIGTDVKNCMCYYFHDIMKVRDFDFHDILLDEKSYEN